VAADIYIYIYIAGDCCTHAHSGWPLIYIYIHSGRPLHSLTQRVAAGCTHTHRVARTTIAGDRRIHTYSGGPLRTKDTRLRCFFCRTPTRSRSHDMQPAKTALTISNRSFRGIFIMCGAQHCGATCDGEQRTSADPCLTTTLTPNLASSIRPSATRRPSPLLLPLHQVSRRRI
jgi:hypothetical protein